MNACVTFGNTFGLDESVQGVSTLQEADRLTCILDDSCFEVPSDYTVYGMARGGSGRRQFSMDEDDELLQYAIQQSLLDAGSEGDQVRKCKTKVCDLTLISVLPKVDIWEALKAQRPVTPQTPRITARNLPPRPVSAQAIRLSPEEEELQRYDLLVK